jgi:hypothetical protein
MRIGPKTWILVQANTITRDKGGNVELGPHLAYVTMVNLEGKDDVPVFTTEDKANAYISASNDTGKLVAVPLSNLGVLVNVLGKVSAMGFAEAMVVDPAGKIGNAQRVLLPKFLSDIRRAMGQ